MNALQLHKRVQFVRNRQQRQRYVRKNISTAKDLVSIRHFSVIEPRISSKTSEREKRADPLTGTGSTKGQR